MLNLMLYTNVDGRIVQRRRGGIKIKKIYVLVFPKRTHKSNPGLP